MRYRAVGKSSLIVSEIGMGTGDNAGPLIHGSHADQVRLLERARELGVNFFDTSPDYGKGCAEVNLGAVLQALRADEAVIVTKVEIMPEHLTRIRERVMESLEGSLLRLRREYVDVLMLHNPCWAERDPSVRVWTPLTGRDILEEVIPAFREARSAGKVRYLGLSCDNAADPTSLGQVLATGDITLINAVYHLANPTAAHRAQGPRREAGRDGLFDDYSGLFDLARERGVGVAIVRPLAGGALTAQVVEHGRDGLHDLSRGWFRFAAEAADQAIARGRPYAFLHRPGEQTLPEAAYRFILTNSTVSAVIGGYSQISHLEEAVRACERLSLPQADLDRIRELHESRVA